MRLWNCVRQEPGMDVATQWQEVNPDGYFLKEVPEDDHTQGTGAEFADPQWECGGVLGLGQEMQ